MSEREEKPQPAHDEAQQSSPTNNGEPFRRAEELLAIGNEDRDESARQAFGAIEGRKTADRPSGLTDDSDALTRAMTGDQRGDDDVDPAAEDEVDDALDEKALEEGVADADETSQIVWGLTPHNL
jgi:hypothetical protein